jgi:ABC-2 type transport system ATP-binding protein
MTDREATATPEASAAPGNFEKPGQGVAGFGADDGAMQTTHTAHTPDTPDTPAPRATRGTPGTPGAPAAIVAERLVRAFDGLTAVDEIDLEIGRGEIYGFLGPNGAGKSTTVRVLCTLLSPTAGRAFVAGCDVATEPDTVRLRIGVALQEAALDPKQTGIELLRLQGRLYGLSRTEIDQRLVELGRLIDIGDALDRRIGTYSGGMKRRLDLAAALVHNPEVLFLDEPTSGLDPVSRARMWEEVRRLNRELDMTIFLTTQYLEEADELADRVGIINDGRIVAEGPPDDLKRRVGNDVIVARLDGSMQAAGVAVEAVPGVRSVEIREDEMVVTAIDGAATIGAVAVALDTVGPVRHLTLRTPTLDDVFLELTGNHIQSEAGTGSREPARPEAMEVAR